MDIFKEKATLEAKKLVENPLNNLQVQRELDELKLTDVDAWYNRKRQLEIEYEQKLASKAQELYTSYITEEKLKELKLTKEELKSKLTVAEYEEFIATGKLPEDLNNNNNEPKEGKNNNNEPKEGKNNNNEPKEGKIPNIIDQKGTNPNNSDGELDFSTKYKNITL